VPDLLFGLQHLVLHDQSLHNVSVLGSGHLAIQSRYRSSAVQFAISLRFVGQPKPTQSRDLSLTPPSPQDLLQEPQGGQSPGLLLQNLGGPESDAQLVISANVSLKAFPPFTGGTAVLLLSLVPKVRSSGMQDLVHGLQLLHSVAVPSTISTSSSSSETPFTLRILYLPGWSAVNPKFSVQFSSLCLIGLSSMHFLVLV
jgi:hypothetical protein